MCNDRPLPEKQSMLTGFDVTTFCTILLQIRSLKSLLKSMEKYNITMYEVACLLANLCSRSCFI